MTTPLTPYWIDCRDGLIAVTPHVSGGYYKRDEVDTHDAALRQRVQELIEASAMVVRINHLHEDTIEALEDKLATVTKVSQQYVDDLAAITKERDDYDRACTKEWEESCLTDGEHLVDKLRGYRARNAKIYVQLQAVESVAHYLWMVLANVSGGDWTQQTLEWQAAVKKARDDYHATLHGTGGGGT